MVSDVISPPPALRLLQPATQLELETNTIDLPVLGLAFLAIPPIHLLVLQPDSDRLQGPLFVICVHAYGHSSTRSERGEEVVIWGGPRVRTAHADRFVGHQRIA